MLDTYIVIRWFAQNVLKWYLLLKQKCSCSQRKEILVSKSTQTFKNVFNVTKVLLCSIIQKWKMEPCDLILIIRLWRIHLLLNYDRWMPLITIYHFNYAIGVINVDSYLSIKIGTNVDAKYTYLIIWLRYSKYAFN